jgi:hypothetical protein
MFLGALPEEASIPVTLSGCNGTAIRNRINRLHQYVFNNIYQCKKPNVLQGTITFVDILTVNIIIDGSWAH